MGAETAPPGFCNPAEMMAVTADIASHHASHSGKASTSEPALDPLPGDFWHIFDRGRSGCTNGNPQRRSLEKALSRADR
jgi:hypothetical protein